MAKSTVLKIQDAVSEIKDEDLLFDEPELAVMAQPEQAVEDLEAVELDFSRELADQWLGQSWQRLYSKVASVRVYADALEPRETPWGVEPVADGLLEMAFHAVEPAGFIYVPAEFASSVVFAGNDFAPALHGYVRYTK